MVWCSLTSCPCTTEQLLLEPGYGEDWSAGENETKRIQRAQIPKTTYTINLHEECTHYRNNALMPRVQSLKLPAPQVHVIRWQQCMKNLHKRTHLSPHKVMEEMQLMLEDSQKLEATEATGCFNALSLWHLQRIVARSVRLISHLQHSTSWNEAFL